MREFKHIKILIFVFFLASCSSNSNWPQFLGPDGNNISTEVDLPVEWGDNKNMLWKFKVPGKGWSSPVVWEEKVFITTAYKDKKENLEKEGEKENPDGAENRIQPDKDYRFEIYCLNKKTGEVIWNETAYLGKPGIVTHRDNTYASETPLQMVNTCMFTLE